MVAGVCGGLAEYFDVDPTIVRVAFVLLTIFNGIGLALYILMWIIVPERTTVRREDKAEDKEEKKDASTDDSVPARHSGAHRSFLGIILVVLGGVLLLEQIMPWHVGGALLLPTVLVAVGLVMVARSFES